jgi:phage baseplate assembly protein W
VAVHSGRKVDVQVTAGPVARVFRLPGPHSAGVVYAFETDTAEEFSLLADCEFSVASVHTADSDVRLCVTNAAALDADVSLAITGALAALADVKLVVAGSLLMSADVLIVIERPPQPDEDNVSDSPRNPALEFLGKGLKFPFAFQRRSGGTQVSTATSSDHAHVHESIRQILGTRKGERFLRPDFGTRLHELVFEPNDHILFGLIRHEVTTALDQWEPRIIVKDVAVVADETDEHLVLVNIIYRLISSQVEANLVYPFFRELE